MGFVFPSIARNNTALTESAPLYSFYQGQTGSRFFTSPRSWPSTPSRIAAHAFHIIGHFGDAVLEGAHHASFPYDSGVSHSLLASTKSEVSGEIRQKTELSMEEGKGRRAGQSYCHPPFVFALRFDLFQVGIRHPRSEPIMISSRNLSRMSSHFPRLVSLFAAIFRVSFNSGGGLEGPTDLVAVCRECPHTYHV